MKHLTRLLKYFQYCRFLRAECGSLRDRMVVLSHDLDRKNAINQDTFLRLSASLFLYKLNNQITGCGERRWNSTSD